MILLASFIFLMMLFTALAFLISIIITGLSIKIVGLTLIAMTIFVFKAWLGIGIAALVTYIFREEFIDDGNNT